MTATLTYLQPLSQTWVLCSMIHLGAFWRPSSQPSRSYCWWIAWAACCNRPASKHRIRMCWSGCSYPSCAPVSYSSIHRAAGRSRRVSGRRWRSPFQIAFPKKRTAPLAAATPRVGSSRVCGAVWRGPYQPRLQSGFAPFTGRLPANPEARPGRVSSGRGGPIAP